VAEKASRLKFTGLVSGEPDYGVFMALESLTLGVTGRACLWRALKEGESHYPALVTTDLDELISRAESQHAALEGARLSAGKNHC
jgi:hypothetical protein